MATSKAEIKKLVECRDQLLAEMEALRNQAAGLDAAISLLEAGKEPAAEGGIGKQRTSVKAVVLDLLNEVGATGLNAATAVEITSRRDIALERGSVSSLLSRLKRDGLVEYDGDKYRLLQFSHNQDRPQMSVVHGGQRDF